MLTELAHQIKEFPEYLLALKGALAVLAMGLPIYAGLRYFLYRRRLTISIGVTLNFIGAFVLFAGLAFLLASPIASHLPDSLTRAYLFVTSAAAALGVVSLIDVFVLRHYLSRVKGIYISPPLRSVVNLGVFCLALLPILRFILNFNPLALIAIPTIATAAVGLALQDTLKAFIAGIGLGHIIRLGEWISFQDKEGRVVDINSSRTTIETADGQRVYIRNSLLQAGVFLNYGAVMAAANRMLKITAPYDVQPDQVKSTLLRCAQGVKAVVTSPAPQAYVSDYTESGVLYTLLYCVEDYRLRLRVHDEVATRVWHAFKREGIPIAYPTRTVQLVQAGDVAQKEHSYIEEELKRWNLAEAFYSEELNDLSQSTEHRVFAPGDIIVRKGDMGQSLFAIIQGTVEVYIDASLEQPVASLGPQDIFGEMSLLTGEPRTATVRAKTSVDVLEVSKTGIQHVMAKRPEICDRLAELVAKRRAAVASAAGGDPPASGEGQAAEDPGALGKRIRRFFGLG